MTPDKKPINGWSVAAYIIAPATVLGFLASAGPALLNKPALTTHAGLWGVGVGAVVGLVVGLIRRFQ